MNSVVIGCFDHDHHFHHLRAANCKCFCSAVIGYHALYTCVVVVPHPIFFPLALLMSIPLQIS